MIADEVDDFEPQLVFRGAEAPAELLEEDDLGLRGAQHDHAVHIRDVERNDTRSRTAFSGFNSPGDRPIPYSESCRKARVGAKSNTKQIGFRISSSLGLSPLGFLIDHGE